MKYSLQLWITVARPIEGSPLQIHDAEAIPRVGDLVTHKDQTYEVTVVRHEIEAGKKSTVHVGAFLTSRSAHEE